MKWLKLPNPSSWRNRIRRNRVRIVMFALMLIGFGTAFSSGVLRPPYFIAKWFAPPPRAISMMLTDAVQFSEMIHRPFDGVTIVNFWATWCEPCREELPEFIHLQKEYAARGLRVLIVNVDGDNKRREVEAFLAQVARQSGTNLRSYIVPVDPPGMIKSLAPEWTDQLPVTMIFDSHGQKTDFWVGKTTFHDLETKIAPLLKAPLAPDQKI